MAVNRIIRLLVSWNSAALWCNVRSSDTPS